MRTLVTYPSRATKTVQFFAAILRFLLAPFRGTCNYCTERCTHHGFGRWHEPVKLCAKHRARHLREFTRVVPLALVAMILACSGCYHVPAQRLMAPVPSAAAVSQCKSLFGSRSAAAAFAAAFGATGSLVGAGAGDVTDKGVKTGLQVGAIVVGAAAAASVVAGVVVGNNYAERRCDPVLMAAGSEP